MEGQKCILISVCHYPFCFVDGENVFLGMCVMFWGWVVVRIGDCIFRILFMLTASHWNTT